MKSEISGEKAEVFGRKPQRVLWKTLLRLEENASAFELKCTCVLEKVLLGVLRGESV